MKPRVKIRSNNNDRDILQFYSEKLNVIQVNDIRNRDSLYHRSTIPSSSIINNRVCALSIPVVVHFCLQAQIDVVIEILVEPIAVGRCKNTMQIDGFSAVEKGTKRLAFHNKRQYIQRPVLYGKTMCKVV